MLRSAFIRSLAGTLAIVGCSAGAATNASNVASNGGSPGSGGAGSNTGGSALGSGGSTSPGDASAGAGGSAGADGSAQPKYTEVKTWIDAYKAAHPGNGGKDWDINAKTGAEVAADPAAERLLSLCGTDQRPVIPSLAWEYGGSDHQWINPDQSALVYCVYVAVNPSTSHWQYDAAADHVTADVYVLFPEQNPCKDRQGADQVRACIGDTTNFEILVDTSSIHDGADVGLSLSNSSTELVLVMPDGSKVSLYSNV